MLTAQGVKKVAEALRLQRQKAIVASDSADKVETADPEKKETGGGAELPVMATARKHVFNQRRLLCDVDGRTGLVSVLVRDSAFYRRGEHFEVRINDSGEWEAALHRSRPKFQ